MKRLGMFLITLMFAGSLIISGCDPSLAQGIGIYESPAGNQWYMFANTNFGTFAANVSQVAGSYKVNVFQSTVKTVAEVASSYIYDGWKSKSWYSIPAGLQSYLAANAQTFASMFGVTLDKITIIVLPVAPDKFTDKYINPKCYLDNGQEIPCGQFQPQVDKGKFQPEQPLNVPIVPACPVINGVAVCP